MAFAGETVRNGPAAGRVPRPAGRGGAAEGTGSLQDAPPSARCRPTSCRWPARIDARDLFRFDPDSADVQCLDAGEVRQGEDRRREVILVAAGKQYVDEFVSRCTAPAARVASLEHRPAAPSGGPPAGSASVRRRAHPRVLLDVGAAQSRLVIGRGDVDPRRSRRSTSAAITFAPRSRASSACRSAKPNSSAAGRRDTTCGRSSTACGKVLGDATRHRDRAARARGAVVRALPRRHVPRPVAATRSSWSAARPDDAQVRSTLCADAAAARQARSTCSAASTPPPSRPPTAREHLGEWAVALGLALKGVPNRRRSTERCRRVR